MLITPHSPRDPEVHDGTHGVPRHACAYRYPVRLPDGWPWL